MPSLTDDLTSLRLVAAPARPEPTAWARPIARPLAGGPLRVLFAGPYSAMQDSHELIRRLDLDACVLPVTDHYTPDAFGVRGFYWPDLEIPADQAIAQLRDALARPWEAMVVAALPAWANYPQDVRHAMLRQVAAGATLLVTDLAGLQPDLAALGLTLATQADAQVEDEASAVKAYACGQGQVAVTPAPEDARHDPRHDQWLGQWLGRGDYEAACARVARWIAAHTLARRGLPVLTAVAVAPAHIELTVAGQATPRALQAELEVRRQQDGQLVAQGRVAVQAGQSASAALPTLPDGDYWLHVRLTLADGAVCDWRVQALRVGGGDQGRTLTFSQADVAAPGQPVVVRYQGRPADRGAAVRWRWLDMLGRQLGQGQLTLGDQTDDHALTLDAPTESLTVLTRLDWSVAEAGGRPLWQGQAMLRLQGLPMEEDFPVFYWSSILSDNWRQRVRSAWLRDHALANAMANTPVDVDAARAAALEGLRTVPYATWFHRILLDENLFDDAWLANTEARARQAAQSHRDYGALAYTLGDENYVSAFEPTGRFADIPAIWQAFQTWLQERYANLGALNNQWQSDYADWADIRFACETALWHAGPDNPSAWVDFRRFISHSFTAALRRMRQAIREEHPGALVGWDGLEHFSSYDGIDLWDICQGMDLIQMYQTKLHPQRHASKIFNGEAVRSFVRRPALSGMWLNSVDRHTGGRMMPWYVLFKGWRSVWWWLGSVPHPVNGAFTWDMQPTAIVHDMVQAVDEIRHSGAAALLTRAEPALCPIAIHYSEANWHASTLESGVGNHLNNMGLQQELWRTTPLLGREAPADDTQQALWGDIQPAGHYAAASRTIHLMLRDIGHQPQTLADAQWDDTPLADLGVKLMVLPFVVALSDRQAQALRDFVAQGGCVIADYRTGLRDEHGRLRPRGALDDLFGLERLSTDVVRQDSLVTFDVLHQAGGQVASTFHDPIRLTTAKAMGHHADSTPAILFNTVGQGQAVYLNMAINDYHQWRRQGVEGPAKAMMATLCKDVARVTPPVTLGDELRRPLAAMETMTFQGQGVSYVGIHPDPSVAGCPARQDMVVTLPQAGHVYDVRRHQSLGHVRSLTLALDRRESILLAVLPHAVGRFHASAAPAWTLGRTWPVQVSLEDVPAGEALAWACRMDVHGPDGQAMAHYSRSVAMDQPRGELKVPLADNDPAGRWRITLTECYTGQRQDLYVNVDDETA